MLSTSVFGPDTPADDYTVFKSNLILGSGHTGFLRKWTAQQNGVKLFVKSSTMDTSGLELKYWESETEVLCYKLASALRLASVRYNMCKVVKDSGEVVESCCYSKNFVTENEECASLSSLIQDYEGSNILENAKRPPYFRTCQIVEHWVGKENLRKFLEILVFDFLVDNPDRHLNNIIFLHNSAKDTWRIAPIFDNGNAYYGNKPDEFLDKNSKEKLEEIAQAKPFRRNHYTQIGLIPHEIIRNIIFNSSLDHLNGLVEGFDSVSNLRRELIKYTIFKRFGYLVNLCNKGD